MEDPVVTACCNKNVCRECAFKQIGFDRECSLCSKFFPLDKEPYPASKFFLKMMNARAVQCTDSECKVEMKYEDFAAHLEKSCKRIVRCCFCRVRHRVVDSHICEAKFRIKKEELKKKLEDQNEQYKKLMAQQRTIFYNMGGYPEDNMPENIEDFDMFFDNLRMPWQPW
ncbi:Oidioi.mRNA.OKI2018_I69.chr2.g7267.t1.cds [Oikopleura dioica]|uniref:Oidioi.mRNA.OKI2018_I69.chr2.g7267.t1.cds n=1 Tax=Oikopleura dioica TaxID=34765 RepID=A0ABN7TAD0_OIKDI|nr:Oidioi.mRNA.OKI2018_I69.chr2.g7267.t1.cds [Oikopleura dioica]